MLIHRVKEEAARLSHGRGVLERLTSTRGVITSAGIALATTVTVFAGLPLVTVAKIGVIVGIDILLDIFLVRTVPGPPLLSTWADADGVNLGYDWDPAGEVA